MCTYSRRKAGSSAPPKSHRTEPHKLSLTTWLRDKYWYGRGYQHIRSRTDLYNVGLKLRLADSELAVPSFSC